MNIQAVADNLRNTINGKEEAMAVYKDAMLNTEGASHRVVATVVKFLEINIIELKAILHDVEQCRPDWTEYLNPVTGEQ